MTLPKHDLAINITGSVEHVVRTYLTVYLASERLPDRQLDVLASLIKRYSIYIADKVKEPYASILLFDTNTRKDVAKELSLSAQHLNNTFDVLVKREILAKEDGKYMMNPDLVPNSTLTFNFKLT